MKSLLATDTLAWVTGGVIWCFAFDQETNTILPPGDRIYYVFSAPPASQRFLGSFRSRDEACRFAIQSRVSALIFTVWGKVN